MYPYYIMDKKLKDINFPEPHKFDEKLFKKFSKLNKKGKNIFGYVGSNVIQALFNLYLLKKYKSDCYLYNEDEQFRLFGIQFNLNDEDDTKQDEEHLNSMAEAFVNCIERDVKIVIIPIIINDIEHEDLHSNILIYRKKYNEIEHFEPHGSYYMLEKEQGERTGKLIADFVEICNEILKKRQKNRIKLIKSEEVCPVIDGLQSLEVNSTLTNPDGSEEQGYCSLWSNFFAEVCLRNPEMKGNELFDICLKFFKNKKNIEDYLRKVIRGYNGIIDEKIEKYMSIITGKKINADKINEYLESNYDKYEKLRLIILELIKLENYMITEKNFNLEKELNKIDIELRKNRFYKNLSEKEKISLLTKKKILENYEKLDNARTIGTSSVKLSENDTISIVSSVLKNYGETAEEIMGTLDDINTFNEAKKTNANLSKSSIASILSDSSFQPKRKRKGIVKNIVETETEESVPETKDKTKTEEKESYSSLQLKKKGKAKNIIETKTETETETETAPKTKTETATKTKTENETIKFPSFELETLNKGNTSQNKLKPKTHKIKSKTSSSKFSKTKKSSIRVKSIQKTIDEERCKADQFFSTKEMKCINIKSIKKSPTTRINAYSLKKHSDPSSITSNCKNGKYYNKKTKKCSKLNIDKVRIPPFITDKNKLNESSRECVEKLLDCLE